VFGFAQWDSPVALVLEALLSVAIVAAFFFVARRVNARAAADRERYLQLRDHLSASSSPPTEPSLLPQQGEGRGTEIEVEVEGQKIERRS
jgi:hypothetical protein